MANINEFKQQIDSLHERLDNKSERLERNLHYEIERLEAKLDRLEEKLDKRTEHKTINLITLFEILLIILIAAIPFSVIYAIFFKQAQ